MKDNMAEKEEGQEKNPLFQILDALAGGKGLKEVLDEIQQETAEENPQGDRAVEMMMELYERFLDLANNRPFEDTYDIMMEFMPVLRDRLKQWSVDEDVKSPRRHSIQLLLGAAMIFDRAGKKLEKRPNKSTEGCDCPACQAMRAAEEKE